MEILCASDTEEEARAQRISLVQELHVYHGHFLTYFRMYVGK